MKTTAILAVTTTTRENRECEKGRHRSGGQLHNSLAGGNSEQVGIDGDGGAALPPPELDAALDPDTAPDPLVTLFLFAFLNFTPIVYFERV
jgi:hypothetical protein